ncbi:hypothetical protein AUP74_02172 [Microbulbifer aggregans]|uniref:Glycine transporter domain-containing protein n=1 Tax=Microbulbifer aggregans TaxID=1769779 RepID=A0A1C9W8V4_9GAMM|nr:TRIC cation channel family protein [Microbulbifer aggregans]AOS97588.1 hypothetical protein AUP74_02172 [Microbulbifer aggregans]
MNVSDLQYFLGMAGTVAFAATAVAAVAPKGIDFFGAIVMGIITAIGGGTIRDVILDVPVFWSLDLNYIWVAIVASLVTFIANRMMTRREIYRSMLYLDALGVSLFAIQATHKVMQYDFGLPLGPVLLGIITAIGGGLIRDVLSNSPTLLMRNELYAIPVTVGCITYYTLMNFSSESAIENGFFSIMLIFCLRSAAIYWDLRVPNWMLTKPTQP